MKLLKPALLVLVLVFAAAKAWDARWVSDDAFISFRYAENLTDGYGLVYNPGERVEGYSNFLWTVLIAAFTVAGFDPVAVSQILGILCFVLTSLLLFDFSARFFPEASARFKQKHGYSFSYLLPIAALLWIFNQHARLFATGGLETSLYTLLLVLGAYLYLREEYVFSVFTYGLAALTRPDGMLFLLFLILALFIRNGFSRQFAVYLTVFLINPVSVLILKAVYYGDWLPNTFYAKDAHAAELQNGLNYFLLFFKSYYVLLSLPVMAVFYFQIAQNPFQRVRENTDKILLFFAAPLFYILYYTAIGGGFMFGRFYIPVLPFVLFWIEFLFQRIHSVFIERHRPFLSRSVQGSDSDFMDQIIDEEGLGPLAVRWLSVFIQGLLFAGMIFRQDPYLRLKVPVIDGITDEHRIYHRVATRNIKQTAIRYRDFFTDNRVRTGITGGGAILAYYLDPPYVFEMESGLTDYRQARKEPDRSRKAGHRKRAGISELQERNVDLAIDPLLTGPESDFDVLYFGGVFEGALVSERSEALKQKFQNYNPVNPDRSDP